MKPLALIGILGVVYAPPANFSDPPQRYRCNAEGVRVIVADDPGAECAKWEAGSLYSNSCYVKALNAIVIPRPWDVSQETLARIMRHELGHACGWPGDHPK